MLGDVNHFYTDTQGRIAAGGNVTLNGYSLGIQLDGAQYAMQDILVAGGDFSFTNGRIYWGNAVYGGTANVTQSGTIDGQLIQGQRIDFGAASAELHDLADQWASTSANGTTTVQYWGGSTAQITLTGTDPSLNVFALSGYDISRANTLTINAPAGSSVVINFDGETNQMTNFGIFLNGVTQSKVLYNFHQTTNLMLSGIDIQGTLLAPDAAINFSNGVIHGQLIGNSLTGMGHVSLAMYDGACVPGTDPTATSTLSETPTQTPTFTPSKTPLSQQNSYP